MRKLIICLILIIVSIIVVVSKLLYSNYCSQISAGICGDSITWTLDKDGTLVLNGSGDMYDYNSNTIPWSSKVDDIKSIIISNGIKNIGDCAFFGCLYVCSIDLPQTISMIGTNAFKNCMSLKNLEIPSSVTYIGCGAFENCKNLNNIIFSNSLKKIDYFSFKGCTDLTNIKIPSSVVTISLGAFDGCINLSNIVVEKGNIKYDSRDNCNAIIEKATNKLIIGCKNTIIPNTVEKIESFAFRCCTELKEIKIPQSVINIGRGIFEGCVNLEEIEVAFDNPVYDSRNNSNAIIEKSINLLVAGCRSTIIPNTVREIDCYAFAGCSELNHIRIPNSIVRISPKAFSNCENLTSIVVDANNPVFDSRDNCNAIIEKKTNKLVVGCKSTTIPNSVEEIGEYAFYDCKGLSKINIPNSVIYMGELCFKGCENLTSVNLPNSITSISDGIFYDCTSLNNVDIPYVVTKIGDYAFYGCTNLNNLVIKKNVTDIGLCAFNGCNNLTSLTVLSDNQMFDSRDNCNAIIETATNTLIVGCKNTKIPDTVTSIGDYAFKGCSSLTSVEIPNSIVSIGRCAFESTGLQKINIPNSVKYIGEEAFFSCIELREIKIPDSVIFIGEKALSSCSNLSTLSIENKNPIYDSRDNCNAVINTYTNVLIFGCKNTKIPSSVVAIDRFAFFGCDHLFYIKIPDSITEIGDYAFNCCSCLKNVTVGCKLSFIGSGAFNNCCSLSKIRFSSLKMPACIHDTFEGVDKRNCMIYVHKSLVEKYKSAEVWTGFSISGY